MWLIFMALDRLCRRVQHQLSLIDPHAVDSNVTFIRSVLLTFFLFLLDSAFEWLVECNPLTPLLQFVLDSSYKLFLHCYAAFGKILTDIPCCVVRLQ